MADLIRPILSFALVLTLLGGAVWLLRRSGIISLRRRSGGSSGARPLERIDRLPLSPQHTLHLVGIGDQTFLIATHPSGCTRLGSVPREEIASRVRKFSEVSG